MNTNNGWKLVPVVPTEEMHVAAVRTIRNCTGNDDFPPRVYAAMLAAAPAAPGSPASTVADEGAKDERQAFEAWGMAGCEMVDDPQSGRLDIARHCAWEAWKARGRTVVPAAGDAQAVSEWAACESRRPWVANSLKASAQDLRGKEKRCRAAFNKDFMGVPSRYVADAYGEAAAVFEAKLAALAASQQGGE